MHWHPLRFAPIYQERIWGGRALADIYGRTLPGERPIGESWEIADRPEGQSVVAEGPLQGRTLAELVAEDPRGLLGEASLLRGRFPLLVKILDARHVLSLQVHPPAAQAAELGGEPKTEFWYFTAAKPGAEIYAGLRPGITRAAFESGLATGAVAECFHRLPVAAGDAMFLPSGRVHALGAGLVLFEIQETSDTTYRVFDWNRVGLDGRPRALHVAESLASIDFADIAPRLVSTGWQRADVGEARPLVADERFRIVARRASAGVGIEMTLTRCVVIGVVRGELRLSANLNSLTLRAGDFGLLPAALEKTWVQVTSDAEWLVTEPGPNETSK